MRLLLFGPPGVGKGTIGRLLTQSYDLPLISVGDLIRDEIKKETTFGKEANRYVKTGQFVPEEAIIGFIIPLLKKDEYKTGFILDGFPRTMKQVEACEEDNLHFDAVIDLEAPEELLIERLSTRRTCKGCDEIYNTKTKPPKIEGVCDTCEGELYQRDDQRPEVIKERLAIYEEKTKPLIDHYQKKKILLRVSAEGGIEKILSDTLVLLKNVAL